MRSSLPLVLAAALAGQGAQGPSWTAAAPGYPWSFPRDHSSHPGYRNEWWYFTGIVESEPPGRRFAYQLTFFRVGLVPGTPPFASAWAAGSLLMAHAATTDLESGEHRFSEALYRAAPLLAGFGAPGDPLLADCPGPPGTGGRWEARLEGGRFRLSMQDQRQGMALALDLVADGVPVLEGPGGLSRKSAREGFASLYYSLPRLATRGTLTVDGKEWPVRGVSWMDKEFGSSQLAPDQAGWDWFALRLSDGRDLMLYLLRRRDGTPDLQAGTLVDRSGRPTYLGEGDFRVRATGRWRSPATGAEYPAGWQVEVPAAGISLRVRPWVADQENRGGRGPHYWEGAVEVQGPLGPSGEGFVELTGYGEGNRPPI